MLLQTLTYYLTGSTAVLKGEENEIIFNNVSLNVSGSEYETSSPGGFSSTVGTIRIELYSGSILIADFPYDQTNLIINSSSATFASSSNNFTFQLNLQSEEYSNSPYVFKIIESSSLNTLTESSLPDLIVNISANSSSKYITELYTGNNKYNSLSLYDVTSSLLLTSSWITGSGSVVLELTGSPFYYINMDTSGSLCCSPTLVSVEGLGYNNLKFTYETGSCGTFNSMSIYKSTDQTNWTLLTSESSYPYIISPLGSYPVSTSYYRLIQHCNDGTNTYNSDPSNILYFIPSITPSVTNFYYISVIGRCNSGSISREFIYSPDSGSTQVSLGNINYTTTYQPITYFYIPSGSTFIIYPNQSQSYGIGYDGSFLGYSSAFNYGTLVSSSSTIYINLDAGLSASYTATLIGKTYSGSYITDIYYGTTVSTAITSAGAATWSDSYQTFNTFSIQSNQPLYIYSTITGLATSSYGFGYNNTKYPYLSTTNSGSLYIKNVVSDVTLYVNVKSGSS